MKDRTLRLAALAALVLAMLAACGTHTSTTPVATGPFTITGVFVFPQPGSHPNQALCTVTRPHRMGGMVIVTDRRDYRLAISPVGLGHWSGHDRACEFPFTVSRVPGGQATYGIGVGGFCPAMFDVATVHRPMVITAAMLAQGRCLVPESRPTTARRRT